MLDMFSAAEPGEVNAAPYAQVMVIDGNGTRGIDVGVMAADTCAAPRFDG